MLGNFRSEPVMKLRFFQRKNDSPVHTNLNLHARKTSKGSFFTDEELSKLGNQPNKSVLSYRFKTRVDSIQERSQNLLNSSTTAKTQVQKQSALQELLLLPTSSIPDLSSVKKSFQEFCLRRGYLRPMIYLELLYKNFQVDSLPNSTLDSILLDTERTFADDRQK